MPHVFLPPQMRPLVGNLSSVAAEGSNVRQVINDLERQFPGLREHLCDDLQMKPGLAVSVDGAISGIGLMQPVNPDSEVHFIPAIGGG